MSMATIGDSLLSGIDTTPDDDSEDLSKLDRGDTLKDEGGEGDGDGDGDDDGTGAGVATGRQHKQETIRRGSIIKPTIRIVHGKPTLECVSSSLITIGHTTPPREEPPRTKPMAAPRLTLICWPTRASIGQARSAMDMPSRTPCARINW